MQNNSFNPGPGFQMPNYYGMNYGAAPQTTGYPVPGVQNPFNQQFNNGDQILKVNGLDGAKAFQTKPNSSIALFDANEDIFYVKSTDAANFPTIRAFRFTEVRDAQNTSEERYVTYDEFAKFREEILGNGKQFVQQRRSANESNAKSKHSEQ